MDLASAQKLLDLHEGATADDVYAALANKVHELAQKRDSAPTDALKQKFVDLEKRLAEAAKVVLARAPVARAPKVEPEPEPVDASTARKPGASSAAPLSATKLADLPGMSEQDAAQVELQPGQLLANRYEIKELIGQGGMGAVYRAFDSNRSEDIAVKVLLPSLTKNERALERFLNEARVSSKLSHPNIVNVFDVQSDGDLYFLTMELLEGQDLRQVMENQKAVGLPMTIDDVKEYIDGICVALANAHETTVHRDIKPENIWIGSDGKLKLMDFGIAQLQSTSQRTQTGAAMGTAYYMAPEQLKGLADIDGRADQYAVAVLAYELLTGEVPAGAIEPVNDLRKDIPKGMANAIMQALSPRAENRFADIQVFNAAIQSGKGAKATRLKRPSSATGGMHAGPNKLVITAVVLVALFGLVGLGAGGYLDFLKPIDKELLSQQQDQANKLVGQIKILRKRLDNSLRELDAEHKEAERNGLNKRHHLAQWQELAEMHIENSDDVVELEGNQAAAEAKLRAAKSNADHAQAIDGLNAVRATVEKLLARFDYIDSYLNALPKTESAKAAWEKFKNTYRITTTPKALSDAEAAEKASNNAKLGSDFAEAVAQLKAAQGYYGAAQKCCADQVGKLNAQWEAERVAREAAARAAAQKKQISDALNSLPKSFSETDYGSSSKTEYEGKLSYSSSITNKGACELNISAQGNREYYSERSKTYTREGTTRCGSGETRIDWEPIRSGQYFSSPAYAECRKTYYESESARSINYTTTVLVAPNNSISMSKKGDWVSLTASFCASGTCTRETKSTYWESSDYTSVKKGLEAYASACGASFSSQ